MSTVQQQKRWGVRSLPATFVLNKHGKVAAHFLKYRHGFGRKLKRVIKGLLG